MGYVRIFNQYIYTPVLALMVIEYFVLYASVYGGVLIRFYPDMVLVNEHLADLPVRAHLFAVLMTLSGIAMGVSQAYGREGMTGMMLRTLVGMALLGVSVLSLLIFWVPSIELYMGRGVLALSVVLAWLVLGLLRYIFYKLVDTQMLRRRVLVLGAGKRASRIKSFFIDNKAGRRFYDLSIVGFCRTGEPAGVDCQLVDVPAGGLWDYCVEHKVREVVVAVDERRNAEQTGGFTLAELLDCKLRGVSVLDELTFYEREGGLLDTRLISPGWMVFSNGFSFGPIRDWLERGFDLASACLLLLLASPILLLTMLAIKLEEGWRAPIFYHQKRVGYGGRIFNVYKFRSMRTDAEKDGKAVWAQKNDCRVTRTGSIIRQFRIDELPQMFNILRGEMSFVGPRPERPEFVQELIGKVPFYGERHRVKPGLAGWAQLCYPYGASIDDAEKKLQYDLYYIKNHNLIFDIYIIIRTVEVVLLSKGVR